MVYSDHPLRVKGIRGEADRGKIDVLCVDGFACRTVRVERRKEAGTPDAVIHTMTVENPRRYFEGG